MVNDTSSARSGGGGGGKKEKREKERRIELMQFVVKSMECVNMGSKITACFICERSKALKSGRGYM